MRRSRGNVESEMVRAGSTLRRAFTDAKRQAHSAWPQNLNAVDESQLGQMAPADVIVLDESPSIRRHVASVFYAIVACPACGALGLITPQQYFGMIPVICPSDRCSCHFRIHERSRLAYLPVN
jgi:hypothetical protein